MKRGIKLEKYEEITILEMRKYHPIPRVRERSQAIELLNIGRNRLEVFRILNMHEDTISDWTVSYNKYGIAGLFDKERSGRPREVTDEIKNRMIEIAESPETSTKNSIRTNIEEEFGTKFHPNTVRYHLKKKKSMSIKEREIA